MIKHWSTIKLLKELLLIYSCGTGAGCSEVLTAYYESSPALKEAAQNLETTIRNKLGETAVNYLLGPAVAYVSRRSATLPITKNIILELQKDGQQKIGWNYEF